jgi:hypothetical protein
MSLTLKGEIQMSNIERKDWENMKREAENGLKQAELMKITHELLLNLSEKELKKFPPEEVKKPLGL